MKARRMPPTPAWRLYRLGTALFRVWSERPGAGAEVLRDRAWMWTPIPSETIADHPLARELSPAEVEELHLPG